MAEAIECVNNVESCTLNRRNSTSEVVLELKNYFNFPETRELDLSQTIQEELKGLELQLYQINLKLKSNQEKILLKKSQNDEIRTIIDYYNLISEKKSVSRSFCTCASKCTAF